MQKALSFKQILQINALLYQRAIEEQQGNIVKILQELKDEEVTILKEWGCDKTCPAYSKPLL